MKYHPLRLRGNQLIGTYARSVRGFSLLEMLFVVAIVLVTTIIAIPLVNNVTGYFKLRGAVSSVTGAIQSTRYQAIFQGCPYRLVFDSVANTYQVQNQCPAGGAFVNACMSGAPACPIPVAGSSAAVTLNGDITLTFSPGGKVVASAPMPMILTYAGKPPESITVSSYGSINVKP